MSPTRARKPRSPSTTAATRRLALDAWQREDGGIGVRVLPTAIRRGELLILDPTEGPMTISEAEADSLATRVVDCDWPPAEDSQRLAPIVAKLRRELQERLRGRTR